MEHIFYDFVELFQCSPTNKCKEKCNLTSGGQMQYLSGQMQYLSGQMQYLTVQMQYLFGQMQYKKPDRDILISLHSALLPSLHRGLPIMQHKYKARQRFFPTAQCNPYPHLYPGSNSPPRPT